MKTNRPDLTLSMDDKIYLAVAKQNTEKLAFVYTLACLRSNGGANSFNLFPTEEIHAFINKDSANLYYETIQQIIDFNINDKVRTQLFETNDEWIQRFLDNTNSR